MGTRLGYAGPEHAPCLRLFATARRGGKCGETRGDWQRFSSSATTASSPVESECSRMQDEWPDLTLFSPGSTCARKSVHPRSSSRSESPHCGAVAAEQQLLGGRCAFDRSRWQWPSDGGFILPWKGDKARTIWQGRPGSPERAEHCTTGAAVLSGEPSIAVERRAGDA
ncbi:hypothetical protein BV20DRAFT_212331 [Pilatotrama ljubarskyi]|nr:hypothetical protein BV20DRAFT_212331 [Pilatotrama ljubarskyi]